MELSHAGLRTQANPGFLGKPEALPGVGCSDLVSHHSEGLALTGIFLAFSNIARVRVSSPTLYR